MKNITITEIMCILGDFAFFLSSVDSLLKNIFGQKYFKNTIRASPCSDMIRPDKSRSRLLAKDIISQRYCKGYQQSPAIAFRSFLAILNTVVCIPD